MYYFGKFSVSALVQCEHSSNVVLNKKKYCKVETTRSSKEIGTPTKSKGKVQAAQELLEQSKISKINIYKF